MERTNLFCGGCTAGTLAETSNEGAWETKKSISYLSEGWITGYQEYLAQQMDNRVCHKMRDAIFN